MTDMDVGASTSAGTREAASAHAEAIVRLRVIDERLAALGDAGTIGFLPRATGREAALVGVIAALSPTDWVFPGASDWPVAALRGMRLDTFVHRVFADANDPLRGREAPAGVSARALRIASSSAPAATHLPHAVGVAWAARTRGEELACVALLDAPEVDAADFHTALNFAGVMKAPVVFACRVRAGQAGAAEHAIAYGLFEARCDGSDADAVEAALREALERALRGEGATVLDLELGADDEAHARAVAALGAERAASLGARFENELASALAAADRAGRPDLSTLFEDVYGELPEHLRAQLAEARG
ncbi:MAG: hypothetical protein KF729_06765 [Sandaracinaceae bacterium]|nr:hypothetical protein [Sandaracinaceae bacterium]